MCILSCTDYSSPPPPQSPGRVTPLGRVIPAHPVVVVVVVEVGNTVPGLLSPGGLSSPLPLPSPLPSPLPFPLSSPLLLPSPADPIFGSVLAVP